MNRDRFTNISTAAAATGAMTIITGIQDFTPERQLAAICATFLLACERYKIEPQIAFTITQNIINGADKIRPEFAAAKMFMQREWK